MHKLYKYMYVKYMKKQVGNVEPFNSWTLSTISCSKYY